MKANDRQIGGDHYKGEYQHWDFASATNMPYVIGCATKYISRWKNKNGVEDLQKSTHYLEKAEECCEYMEVNHINTEHVERFVKQLGREEKRAIKLIYFAKDIGYKHAIDHLFQMIKNNEWGEPTANYINQD